MRKECYLRRLEEFFGAVDSRNEMFVQNNIFSSFVLGDGLCCSFPAWKNVLSFVGNVLDGNDAETTSIVQNFAHVLLVESCIPWIVFRLGDVSHLCFLEVFEVNCHRVQVRFRDYR